MVGYIGCFSVVQSTQKSTGPLSWLGLEAALSLLRMYIWSLNPQSDDAPPLEFVLALDDKPPLPTCNRYSEDIEGDKVLPLTPADEFLHSVTSFTGLIDRFDHPNLTLYYALTRRWVLSTESETSLGEWVLYIAVFDRRDRTALVYTRGDTPYPFLRAIASSIPALVPEHDNLEVKLDQNIDIRVDGIHTLLEQHYQSIMAPYSTSTNMVNGRKYHIECTWTMKRVDTTSAAHKERQAGAMGGGALIIKPSHGATLHDTWERDQEYLEQGRVERMLGVLYTRRGEWIKDYMKLVMRQTREKFEGRGTVRRVDGDTSGGKEKAMDGGVFTSESDAKEVEVERQQLAERLIEEWRWMEELLVYESERWEEQLWQRRRHFVGGSPEKERLTREWRGNCWQRLNANIRAMDARIDAAKTTANSPEFDVSWKWQNAREDIQVEWHHVVQRFLEHETSSSSPSMTLQGLEERLREITEPDWWWPHDGVSRERLKRQCEEMATRLTRELDDIKFRLKQGLEHCDQIWVDEELLECRHSRSTTLILRKSFLAAPLEVYSRALKENQNTANIKFSHFDSDDYQWIADTIRDSLWVTSICVPDRKLLPAIDRTTPLFVYDKYDLDIKSFLENDSHLAESHDTFVFITTGIIAVSFMGPTYGHLILRLTHRSDSTSDSTDLTVMGTSFQLSISSSLTIDDITLHASPPESDKPPSPTVDNITLQDSPPESDKPSFQRGVRNNLLIQTDILYSVYDVQLLDQRGNRYDAASQSHEGVIVVRCVLSIMIDPLQPLIHHDLSQSSTKSYQLGGYVHLEVLKKHHVGYCRAIR